MSEHWFQERVRKRLQELGKKPIPAAVEAGLGRDFISDIVAGRKLSVQGAKLPQLARALECETAYLTDPDYRPEGAPSPAPAEPVSDNPGRQLDLEQLRSFLRDRDRPRTVVQAIQRLRPIERSLPVLGSVAAGVWTDAVARERVDALEWIHIDVQGYERASLYVLKVVGNSMNMVYPAGRYVIVAPVAEAGLREGDHVIVERTKVDVVETTCKELVMEGGRVALWPRSYDENFQTPIYLSGDDADQAAPRIVGVVVADYAKRERPPYNGDFKLTNGNGHAE